MGRGRGRKPKGPKKVSYRLINPDSIEGSQAYPMLRAIQEAHHEDIQHARVALAWNLTWKPDVDGNVKLGQCKKASDLDRELSPYDFVILLRKDFWTHPQTDDAKRRALLDHELCHATIKLDPRTLEPVEDERGRKVYRLRKHDIEEFSAVVSRHGIWKRDIELFSIALRQSKQATLPLGPEPSGPNQVQTAQVLGKVAELAGEPKPSDPHAFESVGRIGLEAQVCKTCGSGPGDPVHGAASAAAAPARASAGNGNGKGHRGPIARAKTRPTKRGHGKAARP